MNALLEDVGWRACTSAYRLDRWRLGELDPAASAEVQSHLDGCSRCREAVAELASAEAAHRASAPPLRLAAGDGRIRGVGSVTQTVRRSARWAAPTAALAAAATLLLVLRPGEGIRSKGPEAQVGMYVQHAGEVRRAAWGEAVQPGDAVRFTYSIARPSYLAILSVDGAGLASVYFPEGPLATRVEAASDALLPLGTRLDAVLGDEQVVALFCDRAQAVEPLRQAVQAAAPGLPEVPGCQRATFRFTKRAGP